jgi:hypothetical protein
MARLAAIEKAFYYPTPDHLMPAIADLVSVNKNLWQTYALDPCAGEGRAINFLQEKFKFGSVYTCELDITRHKQLMEYSWALPNRSLQGDSFRLQFSEDCFSFLFFNPPYDNHEGRLELKWLERFGKALVYGGVMVFIIPHYALKECAINIAENFEDIKILRFPDKDFEIYKQIVIVAKRIPNKNADAKILEWLLHVSKDFSGLPILGQNKWLPTSIDSRSDTPTWVLRNIDINEVKSRYNPWYISGKHGKVIPIPGSIPSIDIDVEMRGPRYSTVMPAAPAHIATSIAAGAFDGIILRPDDESTGYPTLAIRGQYKRDWITEDVKKNAKDEVMGYVERQTPELDINVLDLTRGSMVTLKRTTEPNFDLNYYNNVIAGNIVDDKVKSPIDLFSCGDLLINYGVDMRRALHERIIPIFDPNNDREDIIAPLKRTLFTAQDQRVQAIIRLYKNGQQGVILSGQTGSGKSTMSAAAAAAVITASIMSGEKEGGRILVVAPTHLVYEWVHSQIPAIFNEVDIRELESITDVDNWMNSPVKGLSFGVLSRSSGKLGYQIEGLRGNKCPRCGKILNTDQETRGKKRLLCDNVISIKPKGRAARIAYRLCMALPNLLIGSKLTNDLISPRYLKSLKNKTVNKEEIKSELDNIIIDLVDSEIDEDWAQDVILLLVHAIGDDTYRKNLISSIYNLYLSTERVFLKNLSGELCRYFSKAETYKEVRKILDPKAESYYSWVGYYSETYKGFFNAEYRAISVALDSLHKHSKWTTVVCNEFLYGTVSESPRKILRRYPLMKYIHRNYRDRVSFAISDESHDAKNADTAQSQADQLLYQLGCPWIFMTGTTNDGYPRSLFVALWFANREFRQDYGYHEVSKFQEQYGYNRRQIDEVDEHGRVVEYGSMSNSRRRVRVLGTPAPGIVSTAILKYFLPVTVFINLEDLELDLPPCRENTVYVDPCSDQKRNYHHLLETVKERLRTDRFTDRSGALLGHVAKIGSYLDRCTIDVGNCKTGNYEIRYTEKHGGDLVIAVPGLDKSQYLAKEEFALNYVLNAKAEGRKTLLAVWHVGSNEEDFGEVPLSIRLLNYLRLNGVKAEYLNSKKVQPKNRIKWIQEKVVDKGIECLIVQPVAVQTGINNLVYFSRALFFENPNNSPNTYRQFKGRLLRPGQLLDTEIMNVVYRGTAQEITHQHMMKKVAVSVATDGQDPLEALRSVGADDESTVMSMSLATMILNAA